MRSVDKVSLDDFCHEIIGAPPPKEREQAMKFLKEELKRREQANEVTVRNNTVHLTQLPPESSRSWLTLWRATRRPGSPERRVRRTRSRTGFW